jgi:hypothetical protein
MELCLAVRKLAPCRVRALIPAKHGRLSKKPPKGHWRQQMHETPSSKTKRRRFRYTQRARTGTGFSIIKRR